MNKVRLLMLVMVLTSCDEPQVNTIIKHQEITYASAYPFSSQILSDIHAGTLHPVLNVEKYANIGRYYEAMKAMDEYGMPYGCRPRHTTFDTSTQEVVPAIKFITEEASKYQVVIINEAHHIPYHRFFTMLLLDKLYQCGFHYFGGETLLEADTGLNERKYPVLHSGYYTMEPQYANMIRQAFKSGYKVFAYEYEGTGSGDTRERAQARNIQKFLVNNPGARIVIHCGYEHLNEGTAQERGKSMAGWLKEFTGIDPLTIDQVELTEHPDTGYENEFYTQLRSRDFLVIKSRVMPLAFQFTPAGFTNDIWVYHPRTNIKYNRPEWLFTYYTPAFINDKITIEYPVIVKAMNLTEAHAEAIPIDVVQIDGPDDSTALALIPKVAYRLEVENLKKQRQTIKFEF
jgi:hypothetical protein